MKRSFCILMLVISLCSPLVLLAKRADPSPVPPISRNGVVYSAPNDNGRTGYVVASDLKTGKKLWDLAIYQTKIDSDLEEDVQWVFITSLKFDGDSLIVQDERGSRYRVDLTSRTVKKLISERTVLLWCLLVLAVVLISWLIARARARHHGSLAQQQ